MSDHLSLEINAYQRDLLLEGLRYLRSSRRFEFREPLAPPDERREGDLREIACLMGQLDSSTGTAVSAQR